MTFKALITPAHVREVISTSLTDNEVNGLISAAVALVNARLSDSSLENGTILEIQRWLSAHFVAVKGSMVNIGSTNSGIVEEKLGAASVKYSDSSKSSVDRLSMTNLKGTMWGQTAIAFDTTGTLSNLGGKPGRVVALTEVR